MKKSIFIGVTAVCLSAFFSGCATNFSSWDSWKQDKAGEHLYAEVVTSEAKNGIIEGTAKLLSTGEVVKYVQKPYFSTTEPFKKGTVIFVAK